MKRRVPLVMLRYAEQIGLPEKDATQIYFAWIDRLTFKQIYHKMDQAKAAMKESIDEAKKSNPHKEYRGAIHNDVKVSLGDATIRQLQDSKKWYTDKIKEYKGESFFRDFLLHIQPKLDLINAELAGRIGLKEANEDEIDQIMDFYRKIDDRRFFEDLKKKNPSLFKQIKDAIFSRKK